MGLFETVKPVIVVDARSVFQAKGTRGSIAPHQQLQALRSLSRLVSREKVNVTAVLVGKPLEKAPHNKVFDGVRVRYAKVTEKINIEARKALRKAGSSGVLVTGDIELEQHVRRSGFETLRISTFLKMLNDGNEQVFRGSGGGNHRQNGRHPRQKKNVRPDRASSSNKEKQNNAIRQMIDLVD